MNDIHVTIIAILGMLLTLAVVFDIYLFIDNSKLCKSDAEHKLEASRWKNRFDELSKVKSPVTKPVTNIETFITEPVTFKYILQLSDHISMPEDVKRKIIIDNLCRALADEILANPSFITTYEENDPLTMSIKYMTKIRLIPFKED